MPTLPPGTPDINLTSDDTFGTLNGAVFATGQAQPAGTGTFNAFVQIQRTGTEEGYNTDASAQYNEGSAHNHNHSILLADVPIVIGDGSNGTLEGVAYREFLLDLNDPNGNTKPYMSLDALQIWQEEAGNLTNFTPGAGFAGAHTNYLAYNLDAGGNHWIGLNDALSPGSGGSDVTVLIPDSFFINDAAHRYVTLYSKFGEQSGWTTEGGFEEWGLNRASGGAQSAFSIHKTATVPGGTADVAGEVINYTITVSNTGNTALTGITVTDPSVSNLAAVLSAGFNIGDTNQDNQLSTGETWQYTANHTVTQDDIDTNGGGRGVINNTATADSTQTDPVSASASVIIDRNPSMELTKTPDVTTVDAAGDVIHYTITLANTGNTTLTNPIVEDSQVNIVTPILDDAAPILGNAELLADVLNGDYNIGDTNQSGFQDPGETFQYTNAGDTNQNHVLDPGETFLFANVGDINQNGTQDPGETFQYYNAGDTNHNGVEDDGETFQFNFDHSATTVDANFDGFNDGDTNQDGAVSVGETWQFSVAYTVTQADIDNGGVFNPALTHDNTATGTTTQATDEASASVLIDQNPHVTLLKSATVPGGTANAAGEVIAYAISVTNDGNMTLTTPVVSDPSITNLTAVVSGGFNAGDTDQDGKVDLGETWQYTGSHTVTQDEMDAGGSISNTASVTTAQGASDSDTASITIEQTPHVVLDKTATVPGGTADAGEVISYAISITNDGNVTLTNPVVTDLSVIDLAAVTSGGFNTGDADQDGKVDVGETWHFAASHTVSPPEFEAGGSISNTASVVTDQGASSSDSASVAINFTPAPAMTLVKTALGYHDLNNNDVADAGDVIDYSFAINNTGNVALHNIGVNDLDGAVTVTGSIISSLGVGASDSISWHGSYEIKPLDVTNGYYDNTAVATAEEAGASAGTVHTVLSTLFELTV